MFSSMDVCECISVGQEGEPLGCLCTMPCTCQCTTITHQQGMMVDGSNPQPCRVSLDVETAFQSVCVQHIHHALIAVAVTPLCLTCRQDGKHSNGHFPNHMSQRHLAVRKRRREAYLNSASRCPHMNVLPDPSVVQLSCTSVPPIGQPYT